MVGAFICSRLYHIVIAWSGSPMVPLNRKWKYIDICIVHSSIMIRDHFFMILLRITNPHNGIILFTFSIRHENNWNHRNAKMDHLFLWLSTFSTLRVLEVSSFFLGSTSAWSQNPVCSFLFRHHGLAKKREETYSLQGKKSYL